MLHRPFSADRAHGAEIAPEEAQGLIESTWRKLLYLTVTLPGGVAAGYADCSNAPNSDVELPPKVLVVPGMLAPPNCHAQFVVPVVVKNG